MKKLTTSEFVNKAISIHGDSYDYSITEYVHSLQKVKIICKKHGEFSIRPSNHINNKQGCDMCGIQKTSRAFRKPIEIFLQEVSQKENYSEYNFSEIIPFKTRKDEIFPICNKHGKYKTTPRNVLRSSFFGCSKCRHETDKFNTAKFIQISKQIHKEKYEYLKCDYIKAHELVTITCKEHGEYACKAYIHMAGKGFCPKCTKFVSSYELEIVKFIESIGISDLQTTVRNIDSINEIDILSESHKLAIEFNGLYWHSDIFKNKKYHLNKTEKMNSFGYRLIHIFEDEWIDKKDICKSIISNAFRKNTCKLFARKCDIREVSYSDCKIFLNSNHIQGNCQSKFRYGLYFNNELVSLMTFGNLRKNLGSDSKENHYELLRFCSKQNTNVVGAASKLFKHFIIQKNPEYIVSFCDRRYGTGNLYNVLGFQFEYNSPENYFYVKGLKKYNRFLFRKDILISEGFDPSKTESQIMKERGYLKIYDCGSMKFNWKKR